MIETVVLRQRENAIWTRLLRIVEHHHRMLQFLRLCALVGSFVTGIGSALSGEMFTDFVPTLRGMLVVGGCGLVVVSGAALLLSERGIPNLINDIRTDLSDFREHLDLHRTMTEHENWRRDCEDAVRVMLDAGESALLGDRTAASENLQDVLEFSISPLLDALDITGDDWTLSIFRRNDTKGAMDRIAESWADDGATTIDQRSWVKGQGFTGQAWADNRIVIEPDTTDPRAKHRYTRPPDVTFGVGNASGIRADDERYRSFACVPFRIGKDREPWGVLTVTSDVVGRFDYPETKTRGAQNIPLLKTAAAIFALVAAGST